MDVGTTAPRHYDWRNSHPKLQQTLRVVLLAVAYLIIPFSLLYSAEPDRAILASQPPEFKGKVYESYKDSTPDFSPALPLTAAVGAPNMLVVVLDDVGYGQLGCYGGLDRATV